MFASDSRARGFCSCRSGVAALMFAGQGTPLAESAADRCPAGSSPLLMLTDDRHFTILPAAGAAAEETAAAAGRSAGEMHLPLPSRLLSIA